MLSFRRSAGVWVPLAWGSVKIDRTGDTNDVAMVTETLPGGLLGPKGQLRITSLWSQNNTANVKTARYKLGGTTFMAAVLTSTAQAYITRVIGNRNAQNSQFCSMGQTTPNSYTSATVAIVTGAVDTSVAQDIVISGQLALGTETMSIEHYMIEYLRG